jgi:hypothetical protein
MSSKTIKKKIQDISKEQFAKNRPINVKEIAISFSKFFDQSNSSYIYSGGEKIPFCKRHAEYKNILLNEFVEELR